MSTEIVDRRGRLFGRRRPNLRVLGDDDRDALLGLCQRDEVAHVFVAERVLSGTPISRGGQLWGWFDGDELVSACWSGANFVLVEANEDAIAAFAYRSLRQGRRCMSIFGCAAETLQLWARLAPRWGPAREVRANQPLMQLVGAPQIAADPHVRPATEADLDVLLPACIAMFTEEVGYSPVGNDGGWSYRARVEYLIRSGRSFVRLDDDGQVMFKAELGAVGGRVAQVQGVFVPPAYRGRGLSAPGMAAVSQLTRAAGVPEVSLYVNHYNHRAVAAYQRVGFSQVGTFSTILF